MPMFHLWWKECSWIQDTHWCHNWFNFLLLCIGYFISKILGFHPSILSTLRIQAVWQIAYSSSTNKIGWQFKEILTLMLYFLYMLLLLLHIVYIFHCIRAIPANTCVHNTVIFHYFNYNYILHHKFVGNQKQC